VTWTVVLLLGFAAQDLTAGEKACDPVQVGRDLIDRREEADNLDRALRILEYHAAQKPGNAELRTLAAEAYSRAIERLREDQAADKAAFKLLLPLARPHGEAAVRLAPKDGASLYWQACLLLHDARWNTSLSKAWEASDLLEKSEAVSPKLDDGGPARMRGRVLAQIPAIFGGSMSGALAHYKRSLEISPDCIVTHLWMGEVYADQKKGDLARKELTGVTEAKPRAGHEKEDADYKRQAEERLKSLKK